MARSFDVARVALRLAKSSWEVMRRRLPRGGVWGTGDATWLGISKLKKRRVRTPGSSFSGRRTVALTLCRRWKAGDVDKWRGQQVSQVWDRLAAGRVLCEPCTGVDRRCVSSHSKQDERGRLKPLSESRVGGAEADGIETREQRADLE